MTENILIHKSAEVSNKAIIGKGSKIWHQSQIREGAILGKNCIVGKGVYIDTDAKIGNNVKIQNYALLYKNIIIEDGVFIGPGVRFANDKVPRAVNPDMSPQSEADWEIGTTIVRRGASVGISSTILPNIEVGEFALIGAGSLVTKNVPAHALVYGSPAKIKGYVCRCGEKVKKDYNFKSCEH